MKCPTCGMVSEIASAYCPECGANLKAAQKVAVDTLPDDDLPVSEQIEEVEMATPIENDSALAAEASDSDFASPSDPYTEPGSPDSESRDERITVQDDLVETASERETVEDAGDQTDTDPGTPGFQPAETGEFSRELRALHSLDAPAPDQPSTAPGGPKLESTDKLYTISREAISVADKERLISNLQSKIPQIIRQRQEEFPTEATLGPSPAGPTQAKASPQRDTIPPEAVEPGTEIFAVPKPAGADKRGADAPTARQRHHISFSPKAKTKLTDQFNFVDKALGLLRRAWDRKSLLLAGALVLILIVVAVSLQSRLSAPPPSGRIIGLVINGETKAVIPQAQVVINELGKTLLTNEYGMFRLEMMPPGNWKVSASKPTFKTLTSTVTLTKGDLSVLTLTLEPSLPTRVEPPVQKTITPTDPGADVAKTAAGKLTVNSNVADARVILDNKVLGTGNKTFANLSTGKHRLVLTKDGYQEFSETVEIKSDKTTAVTAELVAVQKGYDPSSLTSDDYVRIAEDLAGQGKWQEAVGNYTLALAKRESAEVYTRRARAYQELSLKEEARADWFKASQAYQTAGQSVQAKECLDHVLELFAQNTKALRQRGYLLLKMGDYIKALSDFRSAVSIEENSFENQLALGEALYITGDNKEALKVLKKARKLNENNARALAISALASMAKGDDQDATRFYQDFQRLATQTDRESLAGNPEWQRLTQLVAKTE